MQGAAWGGGQSEKGTRHLMLSHLFMCHIIRTAAHHGGPDHLGLCVNVREGVVRDNVVRGLGE